LSVAAIAENLLLKQQLIIHGRSRQRATSLTTRDRTLLGVLSLFLNPKRLARLAIIIKPSTVLSFDKALQKRNPRFGCPGIAQQVNLVFSLDLDKDIIRRVLAAHYKPDTPTAARPG
jgi:hypothetical protein